MVFYFLFLERILSPASSAPVEEQDELGLAQFRDICDTSYQNISNKIFRWKHLWDPGEMTNTTDQVRSTKIQQKLQKHPNFSCPLGKSPHFSKTKNNQKLFKQTVKKQLTEKQNTKTETLIQIAMIQIITLITILTYRDQKEGTSKTPKEHVTKTMKQDRSNTKAFQKLKEQQQHENKKETTQIKHTTRQQYTKEQEYQEKVKTKKKLCNMQAYTHVLSEHENKEKKTKRKKDPHTQRTNTTQQHKNWTKIQQTVVEWP